MGRSPCCFKEGLNRGAWTVLEDKILKDYITSHGEGRWRNLPKKAGLQRCGKSCRLRWLNYLRPDIKRGNISPDEEELIIRLHKLLGNRWSLIAGRLPGRTDNEIKNYWNTNLSKKVHDRQHNSILSTRNKQPNQPNESSTRKKAETFMSTRNMSNSQSPLKMESHAIRTKAIKCSKVFFNPNSEKAESFGTNTEAPAALMPGADSSLENSYKLPESKKYDNGSSPIGSQVKINNSSDFMTDFNIMEEFSLSDLLNSEFLDFCGSASNCNDDSNVVSPSSDQPLVFSDELLQDFWTAQANTSASNLNSFTSFFESGGDWLGC